MQTNNALSRLIILAELSLSLSPSRRPIPSYKTETNQNIFATFHYEVKSWRRDADVYVCICMNNEKQIFSPLLTFICIGIS